MELQEVKVEQDRKRPDRLEVEKWFTSVGRRSEIIIYLKTTDKHPEKFY